MFCLVLDACSDGGAFGGACCRALEGILMLRVLFGCFAMRILLLGGLLCKAVLSYSHVRGLCLWDLAPGSTMGPPSYKSILIRGTSRRS